MNIGFRKYLTLIFCLAAQTSFAQVSAANQAALLKSAPIKASAIPKKPRNLLVFQKTSGWTPPQRALVDTAMSILGRQTGAWRVKTISEDAAIMTPESLAGYDAILMNNCNELLLSQAQSKALQDFVKGGKGVIGMGSTISIRNWPEESEMWSGFCFGHPTSGMIALNNEEANHPLTKMFAAQGLKLEDTWYVIYSPTSYSRDKVRVLLSYNWGPTDGPAKDDYAYPWIHTGDYAISYIRNYGKGRVYFNDFMHLKASPIFEKSVLQHLADVTQWALGDLELDESQNQPGPAHIPRPYLGSTKGDATKIPDILTRIKSGDPSAVLDLSKVMPDPRANAAFPDIVKLLTATDSWYTSQRTAMMIARMGDYAKPLAPLIAAKLNDANPVIRTKLLYALEEMGPAAIDAMPAIKAALLDEDWIVRQGAAQALGNIGPAALGEYPRMLQSEEWFTRFQAVQGLGNVIVASGTTPTLTAYLQTAMQDQDPEVVNAAQRALRKIGGSTLLIGGRENPNLSAPKRYRLKLAPNYHGGWWIGKPNPHPENQIFKINGSQVPNNLGTVE